MCDHVIEKTDDWVTGWWVPTVSNSRDTTTMVGGRRALMLLQPLLPSAEPQCGAAP